jgi:2-methylcitrate dehydratase PrpD
VPRPSVARRYARFVLGLALDQVPPPVAAKAASLALDTLGSCLASSREEFGRAVLANATLAHGLDFDDTREDAIVHTGCVAVTTALAVGEALGASGRAVLE